MANNLFLRDNNLFQNGTVIQFTDGEELFIRDNLLIEGIETDQWHVLKEYERLDVLAWLYYGSVVADASKYWWVIADANNIINPLELSEYVGTELLIPNIQRILLLV